MSLKRLLKWAAITAGTLVGLAVLVLGYQLFAFSRAASRLYDVAAPDLVASNDPETISRGRHLAESIGNCVACHGQGLGGRLIEDLGPIGIMYGTNLTTGRGGVGSDYTDGELARAVRHGLDIEGRSLLFMPSLDFNWWPQDDLVAVVSYVRSVPPVDNEVEPTSIRPLGRLLTQFGLFHGLSASMIDHDAEPEVVPDPEPTARYGRFLARSCLACHGERLSGGRIPGAPASLPMPTNLTPHETGLGGWTEGQFIAVLNTGVRPDGTRLDPFMPVEGTAAMNDIEKRALWAYLSSIEPLAEGNR